MSEFTRSWSTMDVIEISKTILQEEVSRQVTANGSGAAKDWSDYKRRQGFIQGLIQAAEIIDEALMSVTTDDD